MPNRVRKSMFSVNKRISTTMCRLIWYKTRSRFSSSSVNRRPLTRKASRSRDGSKACRFALWMSLCWAAWGRRHKWSVRGGTCGASPWCNDQWSVSGNYSITTLVSRGNASRNMASLRAQRNCRRETVDDIPGQDKNSFYLMRIGLVKDPIP